MSVLQTPQSLVMALELGKSMGVDLGSWLQDMVGMCLTVRLPVSQSSGQSLLTYSSKNGTLFRICFYNLSEEIIKHTHTHTSSCANLHTVHTLSLPDTVFLAIPTAVISFHIYVNKNCFVSVKDIQK